MVDPAVVASRIDRLRTYLSKLRILAKLSSQGFISDFKSKENAMTTGARTVRFTVDDGANGVSIPAEVTVIFTVQSIYLPLVLNAHTASP